MKGICSRGLEQARLGSEGDAREQHSLLSTRVLRLHVGVFAYNIQQFVLLLYEVVLAR
jgi:hypothetical protein